MQADLAIFDLQRLGLAGAGHDPVAALVFCNPGQVAHSVINGKVVIRKGDLTVIDLPKVLHRHNQLATQLMT